MSHRILIKLMHQGKTSFSSIFWKWNKAAECYFNAHLQNPIIGNESQLIA